jgi:HEAT repeat protein
MNQPSLHDFRIQIVPLMLTLLLVLAPSLATATNSAAAAQHIQQLSDSDWQVRREAALELGTLADGGKTSVAALTVALGDDDSRVRRAAAIALGQIGPDASRSIPALVIKFGDIDPSVIESTQRNVSVKSDPMRQVPFPG